MIELNDELRHAMTENPEFDSNVAAALMNEIMAEDDKNDPYLESYQDYTASNE